MKNAHEVFSAHAEVVPKIRKQMKRLNSILRARGGSSLIMLISSSLHPVFSAHAEVVPRLMVLHGFGGGILRARGGSSHQYICPARGV